MIIVSSKDGRVGPWFSEGNPPEGFVEVPKDLLEKYRSGEIKDGIELAQKSLAHKAGYKDDRSQGKNVIKIPIPLVKEEKESKEKESKEAEAPAGKAKKVVSAEPSPFDPTPSPFADAVKTRA